MTRNKSRICCRTSAQAVGAMAMAALVAIKEKYLLVGADAVGSSAKEAVDAHLFYQTNERV